MRSLGFLVFLLLVVIIVIMLVFEQKFEKEQFGLCDCKTHKR